MRTTARVQRQTPRGFQTPLSDLTSHGSLPGLVAIARGQTPDPIPNSAVKTLSAHGTAATSGGRVGRRQARQAPQLSPPPSSSLAPQTGGGFPAWAARFLFWRSTRAQRAPVQSCSTLPDSLDRAHR